MEKNNTHPKEEDSSLLRVLSQASRSILCHFCNPQESENQIRENSNELFVRGYRREEEVSLGKLGGGL